MHIRREGDTSQQRSQTLVFGIVYPLFGLAFLAVLDQIYGGHVYKAIKPRVRALLTRMHILSVPDKAQTYALQDELEQDPANTDGDRAGNTRSSTSPSLSGDEPMSILDTHSRIIEGIPSAPPIIPGRPEPLVPNRLEHPALSPPSLPGPSSTSSSKRASLASIAVQAATDEDGYTTDATMSTLPPSYRTHRSHPDLPGYPSTPGERPPLPVAAPASFAEHVFAPPSAYVQPGRRRRNHPQPAPRTVGIPYGVLPPGEPGESEPRADPHGVSGADQYMGEQPHEYPRRSMDGGIRLAGGRLDEV